MSFIKNKIIFLCGVAFFANIRGMDSVFTFDIGSNSQQELLGDADYCSDVEISYDAICDRSPVARAPFYKRIATRLYFFWYSNSLRMKQFAVKGYVFLKQHTILFFKALSNRIKQLRRKTL